MEGLFLFLFFLVLSGTPYHIGPIKQGLVFGCMSI